MNPTLRDYETIELDLDRDWLTIWLNRPESRNALSSAMTGELLEVLGSHRGRPHGPGRDIARTRWRFLRWW